MASVKEGSLIRPCVDCGLLTGRYCDFCELSDRDADAVSDCGRTTPLCSFCEDVFGRCHLCRRPVIELVVVIAVFVVAFGFAFVVVFVVFIAVAVVVVLLSSSSSLWAASPALSTYYSCPSSSSSSLSSS